MLRDRHGRVASALARISPLCCAQHNLLILARPEGLRRDIASACGQARIVEGRFHGGVNDTELVDAFTAQRTADYDALADECRELLSQSAFTPAIQAKVARLEKRKVESDAIDFFNAPGRNEVKNMLDEIRQLNTAGEEAAAPLPEHGTWATRSNVGVDRMASVG